MLNFLSSHKKLFFLSSIVFVAFLFVFLLYLSSFLKYSTIKFEESATAAKENIKFTNIDNLPINLNYDYYERKLPVYQPNSTEIKTNGYFKFTVGYSRKADTPANASVTVKFLLHCDWINYNYYYSSTLSNSSTPPKGNYTVSVGSSLPQSPLFLVKIKHPDLYIRIGITVSGETKYYYVKDTSTMKHNVALID